jgi:hypothetical protein
MKTRIKVTEVPQGFKLPDGGEIKAGDWLPIESGKEMDDMIQTGIKFVTEDQEQLIKAREATIDIAIKASKAFAPKEDVSEVKATALLFESVKPGSGLQYINNLPPRKTEDSTLTARQTPADGADIITGSRIVMGEAGFRDTLKGFFKASLPDYQQRGNGGFVRASCRTEKEMANGVTLAREKASFVQQISDMIVKGADYRLTEDLIKAAADNYADPAGALGVLNTAITLNWNFGHLENELVMLSDVTTDVTGTPVKYKEWARSRYIKVPGVQIKALGTAWSGGTGNAVDVSINMANYVGTFISVENATLGSTARPLMNEQQPAQLYSLAEYITYTLINAAINGSSQFNNDGVTLATVKAQSAYVDPNFGLGTYSLAQPYPAVADGGLLGVFTGGIPTAMDISKFPGGKEAPSVSNLARFAWVHSAIHGALAANPVFAQIQSIQGIRQTPESNLLLTGQFERLGNMKIRASQLMSDQNSTTGSGADAGANAQYIVPGNFAAAGVVGVGGTRSGLMFVSRAPVDYSKVLDVPQTAAIELYTSPKLGIPFMVVKYMENSLETANLRVQLMWGVGVGDPRQLMLFRQK